MMPHFKTMKQNYQYAETFTKEYAEKVLNGLQTKCEFNKEYDISRRPDREVFLSLVERLLDLGASIVLSKDNNAFTVTKKDDIKIKDVMDFRWHKLVRLPEGVRVERIDAGTTEQWTDAKGIGQRHTFEKDFYRIYSGDKLIATESK